MKKPYLKRKSTLLIFGVLAMLLSLAAAYFLSQKDSAPLSQELVQKFGCDRLTLENRSTDIFCGYPKFYNDPDSVTYSEFKEYAQCDESFKDLPEGFSAEDYLDVDRQLYIQYVACKDPAKLDMFVQYLKELKSDTQAP